MPPDPLPDDVERELAARLEAQDALHGPGGSADPGELTAGLPPEEAARLQAAIEGLSRLHARWPGASRPEDAPRAFGKFLIERELGRGGHGIVFLAVDPALKRRVALKIPRPELLDEPDWCRRFLREAHALARLDHPGIVAVLEVGEADGVCYIAASYCDGPDLASWLRGRRESLSPRTAARVACMIAEAVGHAHAQGVVHRDLKPRNILMQAADSATGPDEPGARPRVTDFGLAKLIDAEAELTRTGAVLGTPRYMAPEQKEARHDKVGPSTDVYAIGAILDELLGSRQSAPRMLQAIVAKCLESEPARRYQDASLVAADLNGFLSGGRVRAGRRSPRAILARTRRQPLLAISAVAIGLLLTAVYFLGGRPSRDPGSSQATHAELSPQPHGAEPIEAWKRYVADMQLVASLAPSDLAASNYKLPETRDLLNRYRTPGPEGDLRTSEWYHFERMLHGERATLAGHQSAIYHMEYSRDGTRLASSGEDGVRVWNAAKGALELTLRDHSGSVNWVGFSPDGTKLATTSDDRTVCVWSAIDGRRLLSPLTHQHKTVVVLFTPDGQRLIACDRGGIVTTWDITTGAAVKSQKVSDEPLEGMDLSSDGTTLAVASSHDLSLWDYPAMTRRPFRVPGDKRLERFDCVAFSHDGRTFAACGGGTGGQILVLNTRTGRLEHSWTHHADERVMTVAFSRDDRLLLSTGSDQAARVWDLTRGQCVAILAGHDAWVWCGGFAVDGKSVATGDGKGSTKLWDIPPRGMETRLERSSPSCLAMAYSSDGRSLYTATSPGHLEKWDPATGAFRGHLPFRPAKAPVGAAFSAGASRVATVDGDGTLTVGSPLKEAPDLTLPRATAAPTCLAFSVDGGTLAYVDRAGGVVRLGLNGRQPRPAVTAWPPSTATCLAFAPDGRLLAGTVDGRLVDCHAGRVNSGGREHPGRITCLAVSSDGTLCATGGDDAAIVIWDRVTLRSRARLVGSSGPARALGFTPDNMTLITLSPGVRLWNVATARPTLDLSSPYSSGFPGNLAIAPAGTSVAAMFNQGTVGVGLIWAAPRSGGE